MEMTDTVYCAAVTPMNENQTIDAAGFMSNIDWYIDQGLSGILINGGTGEFASLSKQERQQQAEMGVETVNRRIRTMVCCASETTAEAVDYARHAQATGADSIMVAVSYYFKPSDEEAYQHIKAICQSVDLPVVLYNNPSSSGTDLSPATICRIGQIDQVKWVKESSGDLLRVREIRELSDNQIHVFCGSDDIACESFLNGADGWISITANALPGQSQMIFNFAQSGKWLEACCLFRQYAPLYMRAERPYKAIQTIKYCLDLLGQYGGASRLPRLQLTRDEKTELSLMMKQIGLLEVTPL